MENTDNDFILRIISKEAGIRVMLAVTTEIGQEAADRHQTSPTATEALSRAMTSAALIGTTIKVRHRIALKYRGIGPLGKIIVESDAYGKIRGYLSSPAVDVPAEIGVDRVAKALGEGHLSVVKDVKLSELIEGIVPMVNGSIGDDVAYYLNQSEQIVSHVQLGTILADDDTIAMAGGILIQSIGDGGSDVVKIMADRLEEMPPVVEQLKAGVVSGWSLAESAENIVASLLTEIDYDILEKRTLLFNCSCSYERSEAAIISLGRQGIESLIEEGEAVVDCHFCHERYVFTAEDLETILLDLE